MSPFTIGFLVNPIAGAGGTLALKGSDDLAGSQVTSDHSSKRAQRVLTSLANNPHIKWLTWGKKMGEDLLNQQGIEHQCLGSYQGVSQPQDTQMAVTSMVNAGIDLLIFTGGDGTARDIADALSADEGLPRIPVVGIPAGVKMHSSVYAVSPEAAAELINTLITGGMIKATEGEVRDIDETAFRQGRVTSRFYGELLIPEAGGFLQHTKNSGREVEELAIDEIAAEVLERTAPDDLLILGPGSTTYAIKQITLQNKNIQPTLLGIDVIKDGDFVIKDANETELFETLDKHTKAHIYLTAIGGQGHILGRGNQVISPRVIKKVGLNNLHIVATRTKLNELQGRPLLVDSNDPELDKCFTGFIEVITGYHDVMLYPVGLAKSQD